MGLSESILLCAAGFYTLAFLGGALLNKLKFYE